MFDFLIVGAGLYGATLANELKKKYTVCVVEKTNEIGGTCYAYSQNGILIHKYGAHIFRTDDKEILEYIEKFDEVRFYSHNVIGKDLKTSYNLPFNMNTFVNLFQTNDINKICKKLKFKKHKNKKQNLKTYAEENFGKVLYKKFLKEYTEKQWGKKCKNLPSSIIEGLPIRYVYDNSYFKEKYVFIPKNGYSYIIEKMLEGVSVLKNVAITNSNKNFIEAKKIIHTGMIDEFFNYCYGKLEYRSLDFKHKWYNSNSITGTAVTNYLSKKVPYTRTIEHKFFGESNNPKQTIVTYEYPAMYNGVNNPYYPINDEKNNNLYKKYKELAKKEGIIFAGRLGGYVYNQMASTVKDALELAKELV